MLGELPLVQVHVYSRVVCGQCQRCPIRNGEHWAYWVTVVWGCPATADLRAGAGLRAAPRLTQSFRDLGDGDIQGAGRGVVLSAGDGREGCGREEEGGAEHGGGCLMDA